MEVIDTYILQENHNISEPVITCMDFEERTWKSNLMIISIGFICFAFIKR